MKPILFNSEMVRAILDNRKTVTRRVVKPQPAHNADVVPSPRPWTAFETETDMWHIKPPYRPGDILYVRETWTTLVGSYIYKVDQKPGIKNPGKWHPSIHMPREAARIFLRVTDVRVERLHDITEEQAVKEGVEAYHSDSGYYEPATLGFVETWNSTIKKSDFALYGWDANPWVWVIEFERIGREEATL